MADGKDITKYTEQYIENYSFNDNLKIKEVLVHGYDSVTGTTQAINVDENGNLGIEFVGKVCDETSTPLTGNETFTGETCDLKDYAGITIGVYADVPSATNGLKFQISKDGNTWHTTDEYTYLDDGVTKVYTPTRGFRYGRVTYTNGVTAQGAFELQMIATPAAGKPSSHKIQDDLVDEDDGELQIAVLKLRTAQNDYVSGAATNAGNFKVSLEEIETEVETFLTGLTNLLATEATLSKTVGFDKNSDITITKTVVGNVITFVKTDGVKTQTITINKDTGITTKVWS